MLSQRLFHLINVTWLWFDSGSMQIYDQYSFAQMIRKSVHSITCVRRLKLAPKIARVNSHFRQAPTFPKHISSSFFSSIIICLGGLKMIFSLPFAFHANILIGPQETLGPRSDAPAAPPSRRPLRCCASPLTSWSMCWTDWRIEEKLENRGKTGENHKRVSCCVDCKRHGPVVQKAISLIQDLSKFQRQLSDHSAEKSWNFL